MEYEITMAAQGESTECTPVGGTNGDGSPRHVNRQLNGPLYSVNIETELCDFKDLLTKVKSVLSSFRPRKRLAQLGVNGRRRPDLCETDNKRTGDVANGTDTLSAR
jgi:hypothetical protein